MYRCDPCSSPQNLCLQVDNPQKNSVNPILSSFGNFLLVLDRRGDHKVFISPRFLIRVGPYLV